MRKVFTLFLLISLSLSTYAKDGFQGSIKGANNKPLKGIRINIIGLFKYTKTNSNGIFKFKKVLDNDSIMVFCDDKTVIKVPVRSDKYPQITLEKNYATCISGKDTLICSYQPAPIKTFDNSIITQRQIRERAPKDLIDLLRGSAAGLRIYEEGGSSKASLRYSSSFELSTEPLFIIDKTEYETLEAANNSISIEDIEEVRIIKDGGGYGMKGANGVIIIKTHGN